MWHPAPLLIIALMLYATVLSLKHRQDLLLLIYAALFLAPLTLWHWYGGRFLVPIVPVLVFFLVRVVLDLVGRLEKFGLRWAGRTVAFVVFAWMLADNAGMVGNLVRFSRLHPGRTWR